MPSDPALEELLSRPTPALVEAMGRLEGGMLVLGAGGKMGPSLCRLARRASREAGIDRRVVAAARFSEPALEPALRADGIETVRCDLLDPAGLEALPDLPNVLFLAGQKFGTTGQEPRTWAINAFLPGLVIRRFSAARLVAFSTGNVYPLADARSEGPAETDATGPVGEYAWSALARERVLEHFSQMQGTPVAILRLNYAVEPRYGVLRDLADRIVRGEAIDLSMGRVNLIWQRDANAVALRAFAHCAVPPFRVNLTGRPAHAVRDLAAGLGERLGIAPRFEGREQDTALLSDAARCEALFGPTAVGIEEMLDLVAGWVAQGGRALGKPTHYENREGAF